MGLLFTLQCPFHTQVKLKLVVILPGMNKPKAFKQSEMNDYVKCLYAYAHIRKIDKRSPRQNLLLRAVTISFFCERHHDVHHH
jgi:hypothetical protein